MAILSIVFPFDASDQRGTDAALIATVVLNLHQMRRRRLPPLYLSGVRYRQERCLVPSVPETCERFLTFEQLLIERWGDRDDLAAGRCAELIHTGEDVKARARVYRAGIGYHAIVRRGDGRIEDPFVVLEHAGAGPAAKDRADMNGKVLVLLGLGGLAIAFAASRAKAASAAPAQPEPQEPPQLPPGFPSQPSQPAYQPPPTPDDPDYTADRGGASPGVQAPPVVLPPEAPLPLPEEAPPLRVPSSPAYGGGGSGDAPIPSVPITLTSEGPLKLAVRQRSAGRAGG